jgi:hypothetical protein
MQQAYQATPFLQSNILASLRVQTEAWRDLIQDEFTNRHSVVGSINYGVRCWKVAIPTYLAEEASDIKTHTVATNIGLYLKLIEALVAEVLDSVKGTSTTVHLFASANILPVEYFNWRDDFNKAEKKRGMIGISRPFMDEYRKNIKAWVRLPNALMTRVFLVNSLPLTPPQREEAFPRMSIQDFATLQEQGELKILCQATDGQPKKMRVSQIMEYTQDVPQWLLTEQSQKDAYAIAKYFRKSDDELAKANLALRSLIEVVVEELHSRSPQGAPVNEYARYFEISDDERLKHLENLPKIPTRLGYIKSPDFLAIRLADGGASRTIACIAAQLNPDFETMSLSLITEKVALEGVDKFIGYATRESQPLSTLPR